MPLVASNGIPRKKKAQRIAGHEINSDAPGFLKRTFLMLLLHRRG